MSGIESLDINQGNDWLNHSKVIIRTGNQDLLNSLYCKAAEMSNNGFGKLIYNYGNKDNELRIFSKLGSGVEILLHLLEGQDYGRLVSEAVIETVN